MNFDSVCEYLQDNVPWRRYVDFIEVLGPQCNDEGMRFLKSRFIEGAICRFCSRKDDMEWIDKRGRDIEIQSLRATIECKYRQNCVATCRGKTKDILGAGVKLYNSNGTNKRIRLASDYSKYVLLLDARSAAVIKKPLIRDTNQNGDSITLKGVPREQAHILFEHDDYEPRTRFEDMSVAQQNFVRNGLDRMLTEMLEFIL